MPSMILQDGERKVELDLEIESDDLQKIMALTEDLADRGIEVSRRAQFATVFLACEAVAANRPSTGRHLSMSGIHRQRRSYGRNYRLLGYQMLALAHGRTIGGGSKITIFDAIRQAAQLSVNCGCIFRVPPMPPPLRPRAA